MSFYRVNRGRERHAVHDHQQVAERQIENINVGHIPHLLVPHKYQHQRAVADSADDEYHGEQRRHDVRLRTLSVVVIVYRPSVVGGDICHITIILVSGHKIRRLGALRALLWTNG